MGDRRTAEIRQQGGSIYVYTHWSGYRFVEVAEEAIVAAGPRDGDDSYQMRILVDQMIKANRDQETGSGIMLWAGAEDEYGGNPSIVIDCVKSVLRVTGEPDRTFHEVRRQLGLSWADRRREAQNAILSQVELEERAWQAMADSQSPAT